MHTAKFDLNSFSERLAVDIIDWLTSDSEQMPIVNHDHTYGVNSFLERKGYTSYSMIVYHGSPSPHPHYTLNRRSEYQQGVEMLDISEEQALALHMGLLNINDLVFHIREPERYSIPSNEELADQILAAK